MRLLEGAVMEVQDAKSEMQKESTSELKTEEKGYIMRAISIIDALRGGLNLDSGGEIAENLDSLYEYMGRRLVEGFQHRDAVMMDEVNGLLVNILDGWKVVPDSEALQAIAA
jgi:flagellar protein FliS